MGFNGPHLMGINFAEKPLSAVSWAPGRLDIFGIDDQRRLRHWWYDRGWGNSGNPEILPTPVDLSDSGLSAVSWQPGRLDVFAVSAHDGDLQHWWFDNGWGGPESRGGSLIGDV